MLIAMTDAARTDTARTVTPSGYAGNMHQEQYDDPVAEFFWRMRNLTGEIQLYTGYLQGYFANKRNRGESLNLAADFGCGTGWLLTKLARDVGFENVVGVDTSEAMRRLAWKSVSSELAGRIKVKPVLNGEHAGKCDLVVAIHLTYHFTTNEELRSGFFGAIHHALNEKGEAIVISAHPDFVHNTPAYYQNSIAATQLTSQEREDLELSIDSGGFISLADYYKHTSGKMPSFVDKAQMTVRFTIPKQHGRGVDCIQLTDTHHARTSVLEQAKAASLEFVRETPLYLGSHPVPAYVAWHFRLRPPTSTP